MQLEFFLARKYLASRRGHGLSVITWIALAGVIVGVMSLVTVNSVMSGFEKELRSKILGNNAHIVVTSFNEDKSETYFSDLLKRVQNFEGVRSAMPVVYGEAFILSPRGDSEGAFVKGVPEALVREVLDLEDYVSFGAWDDFKNNHAILGASLARRLGVSPGQSVTFLLNKGDFSPLGMVPRMKKLEVSDIFSSGMTQYDAQHVYIPLDFAETLFERSAYQIEVRAEDPRRIESIRASLDQELGSEADVIDWLSRNRDFLSALKMEKLVMGIILGLIVLVAAFNICGSLIMVVRDKTRDIAILKSMGTSDSRVLRIFLIQGIFIGVVGTLVGLVLGVVVSVLLRDYIQFPLDPNVYMIDQVPVDIRWLDVLSIGIGAILISAGATLYPARLAASLDPIEGLKVE